MSANHPNAACQAFDVLHEEFRRLNRENAELRRDVHQKEAANGILADENTDLKKQVAQLRGHCARKFGLDKAAGLDVTGIIEVVS